MNLMADVNALAVLDPVAADKHFSVRRKPAPGGFPLLLSFRSRGDGRYRHRHKLRWRRLMWLYAITLRLIIELALNALDHHWRPADDATAVDNFGWVYSAVLLFFFHMAGY